MPTRLFGILLKEINLIIFYQTAESDGILGFSLYPHHLNNSSNCSLEDFCSMIAKTVDLWE